MNRKSHFLALSDYTGDELNELLNMADQLKYEQKHRMEQTGLRGRTLGMIFDRRSTRTRVSFETGMYQLGGMAMFLSDRDLQLGQGEPMQDTARVLSGYLDGLMIRTGSHADAETLAEYAAVPVINGRTDFAHPCQVLADLMTIREYKRTFRDKKVCYVGCGGSVANSLIVGALKVGMTVTAACPEGCDPDAGILAWAGETGRFTLTRDPMGAAEGADVVYSGLWDREISEKDEESQKKGFSNFQVNDILTRIAKTDAIVLHCLPAHRGQEITGEVFEGHAGEIFTQAENRLHAQKAVLLRLLGDH